jgi:hypothetical protein
MSLRVRGGASLCLTRASAADTPKASKKESGTRVAIADVYDADVDATVVLGAKTAMGPPK